MRPEDWKDIKEYGDVKKMAIRRVIVKKGRNILRKSGLEREVNYDENSVMHYRCAVYIHRIHPFTWFKCSGYIVDMVP